MIRPSSLRPAAAIALGTFLVGSLDLLDALIFFGLRGAEPMRILQSIASGVLGKASFTGGSESAALGLGLHYVIAFGIVLTYYLISLRWRALRQRPVVNGFWYGVLVYLVMNLVVVPLSAAAPARKVLAVVVNGVLIHIVGVGIPTAWSIGRVEEVG